MSLLNAHASILIVDDDEDDFIITGEYIKAIPGNTFKLEWSSNYNNGLKGLLSGKYDICFVDYRLGVKTGSTIFSRKQ